LTAGSLNAFGPAAYAGTDDAMVLTNGGGFFNSSSENFGTRTDMAVGNAIVAGQDAPRRTLLRFDVSSLAGNYSSIQSADLTLYVSGTPASSGQLNVFRLA